MKELRLRAGLTQAEVAKQMNVSQVAVHRWETGDTNIARKHHKRLAKLYGCTLQELDEAIEGSRKENT